MSKSINFSAMGICEPNERIKYLASYGNTLEIDPNIPANRFLFIYYFNYLFFSIKTFFYLKDIIVLAMK